MTQLEVTLLAMQKIMAIQPIYKFDYKIPFRGSPTTFVQGSVKASNEKEAREMASLNRGMDLNLDAIEIKYAGLWEDFQKDLDRWGCD